MVIKLKNTWITLCVSLSLCACSTAKVSQGTIPEQGLTVSQLYHQSRPEAPPRRIAKPVSMNHQQQFKALANPEVPIHIFAHVANIGDEQIIKPAYDTRFFLYKNNQYALASELY
ncbi:TIGR03751 family conjugal transfer lipoprotein [Legionella israelensis]|uniref:TIGR03751 family conjugal transfer lipoprotein n=1 Tax=Legionella israelensis TaxID=454 RepID=A0AAX1EHY4_9GAMM|nr:TIGR03751 family conjugal transfer lipoprotein [Legionella israelensis]QBR84692.1 TIGR03751 family conjugal transfer lipoprotein [Legionella israelensis]